MGLAQQYNRTLKNEVDAYAAWFPVTNTFSIGDYGLIENGVFRAIGNVATKFPDIELKVQDGPPAQINFSSTGTRMVKIGADGEVDSFSQLGDAEAKLKIQFSSENSIVLKANLSSKELSNIDEVATKLISKSKWKRNYKVVSSVYTGEKCVVICSRDAGTEIMLEGKANILKQVEMGKVDGNISVTSSTHSIFESIGVTGVICLNLFKIGLIRDVNLLGEIQPQDIEIVREFGPELEDDF